MLGPERSTPCVVHRFDRAVPFLAPVLERAFGVLGIVEAVVASVLVTNVPSDHIGIVLVMLRHRPAELQCVLTEHRTGGTPVLARAGLAELVDDSVEPAEIVHVFAGFDFRPGEDAHGYEVHSRLDHEAHVLVPDLLGPLVGIVVAAVPDTGPPALQRPRPTMFSTLVHCHCSFRVAPSRFPDQGAARRPRIPERADRSGSLSRHFDGRSQMPAQGSASPLPPRRPD